MACKMGLSRAPWRRTAVAVACLSMGLAAQAANVLVLSTQESPTDAFYNTPLITGRVKAEFSAGGANTVDVSTLDLATAGAVTASTFVPTAGGRYDVVVVLSTYKDVHATNMTAITTAMQPKPGQVATWGCPKPTACLLLGL